MSQTIVQSQFDTPVQQRETATLGMWVFLATEVMFPAACSSATHTSGGLNPV